MNIQTSGLSRALRSAALSGALGGLVLAGAAGTTDPRAAGAIDLVERHATLPASVTYVLHQHGEGACYGENLGVPPGGAGFVGYQYHAEQHLLGDCQTGTVYQARVYVDFTSLDNQGGKIVTRARLLWVEEMIRRQGDEGFRSCIAAVDGADSRRSESGQIPSSYVGSTPISGTEWDVKAAAIQWFPNPEENHGFVLKGHNEGFPFTNAACVSVVSQAHAEVDFLVDAPATRTPRPIPVSDAIRDVTDERGASTFPTELFPTATPAIVERTDGLIIEQNVARVGLPTPTPTQILPPGAPRLASDEARAAGLRVTKVEVRGKGARRGSTCDVGENDVRVTVRNSGPALAESFAVRLAVDGDPEGQPRCADGLKPGEDVVVTFEGVKLQQGQREIEATLDPSGDSTNALSQRVTCGGQ